MHTTTVHIPANTPWLPPSLRGLPGPVEHTVQFSKAERKVLRKRKKIRPSVWVEKHRVVTVSRLPGKWRNIVTPYVAGIMDASFFDSVREITVIAPPQSAKSEAIINCIGYAIDRAPGPVILVYPDENTSDTNSEDRIQTMITSSQRLRSYTTGLADDLAKKKIKLQHMPIHFGWARSAASIANRPCRYAVSEEVDKYPPTSGKRETSPILLTKARLITYEGEEKHWIVTTPTIREAPGWTYYLAAQVRFEYVVKCPVCGDFHCMKFGSIKWPRAKEPGPDGVYHSMDPATIEAEDLARYECPRCGAEWNDHVRDLAVRGGRWQDKETGMELYEYLKTHRPKKIAFQYPSWISPFVPLSKPAASFLKGQTDLTEFKDFHNKHAARPWRMITISSSADEILKARSLVPAQTVPAEAIALTCGVDVQKFGFWFIVRAWAAEMTNWLIHYGFLMTWENVEELIFKNRYPVIDSSRSMGIWRAAVDTGGGKKYETMTMTEETYLWLIKNRGRGGVATWGTKGASGALAGMLSLGNAITSTPSGKKLTGGLRILSIDTAKAKDQFHYRLGLAAQGLTGGAYLHAGTETDYVNQILAEEKQTDEKGREEWVNPHSRPNHLFDAEILAASCAEMEFPGGGLRLLAEAARRNRDMEVNQVAAHRETDPGAGIRNRGRDMLDRVRTRRPGWLGRR